MSMTVDLAIEMIRATPDPLVTLEIASNASLREINAAIRECQSEANDPELDDESRNDAAMRLECLAVAKNKELRAFLKPDANWEAVDRVIDPRC